MYICRWKKQKTECVKKQEKELAMLENNQEEKHLQKLHECTSFDSMMVMQLGTP